MKIKFKPIISRSSVILILIIQLISITLLLIFSTLKELSSQSFFSIILTNLFLPLLTTLIFHFFDKYVVLNEIKIISEHTGGFKSLTNLDLNYSKPLKMIFTNIDKSFFPAEILENLNNFSKIHLVLAHSQFVSNARAISLNKENYYENGINKTSNTFDYFSKKKITNMRIVEVEQNQFPLGIMIHNNNWIYFAPFWNHENSTDGAVEDICVKVPINSEFGRHILESFDSLFKNGNEVTNFDIKQIQNTGS